MMHSQPKVSVIVPVYNAAPYIERCARSLFSQTLDSIEYIFVNDKTPDNSIDILQQVLAEYPERLPWVKIIDMTVNSQQAAARSRGLKESTGEYVIHCDPDDWVDVDYYRQLYKKANEDNLDLVTGDIEYHYSNNKTRRDIIADFTSPIQVLQSDSFFLLPLWSNLVKSDLIRKQRIDFYNGVNFMEDFGFLFRVYFCAHSAGHIHNVYYHYNKENENSITTRINSKGIIEQRIKCLKCLDQFFLGHNVDVKQFGLMQRSKRDVKDLWLNKNSLKIWRNLFPEVSHWILKQREASLSYRLVYYLSHHIGVWPMKIFLSVKDKMA